jgi:hypothetical protein
MASLDFERHCNDGNGFNIGLSDAIGCGDFKESQKRSIMGFVTNIQFVLIGT